MDPVPPFSDVAVYDFRLIVPHKHILVAVSGGRDSMALLHAMSSARVSRGDDVSPWKVTAAHYDHQLRDDSHRDRELVERACADWDIPRVVGRGDVRAEARERGESVEEAARRMRYAFLEATADDVGADLIVTAHTRDDQIETILMRILRGSGIRGLAGIPARRGRIARPMLMVDRRDITTYCEQHSVPFIDDPSNRDTRFERNYIRHEVLPSLETGFPDASSNILALGAEAARTVARIRKQTDPVLDEYLFEESPGVWTMEIAPLTAIDDASVYVLFGDAVHYRMGHPMELGRTHYGALRRLLTSPSGSHSLPGMLVRREHEQLVFYEGGLPPRPDTGARITLPIGFGRSFGHHRIQSREIDRGREKPDSWRGKTERRPESGGDVKLAVAYFAREQVTPPFIVRNPAPGDRMCPFGMGGRQKKLSDIFIDRKIPRRVRERALVVEDQTRIIWVAGVTTSDDTRVTDATSHVVELTAKSNR